MKLTRTVQERQVTINGCTFTVPKWVKYITINNYGSVELWPDDDAPVLYEGYWYSNGREPKEGEYFGNVTLEDGDKWTTPYNVHAGRWYESCYDDE